MCRGTPLILLSPARLAAAFALLLAGAFSAGAQEAPPDRATFGVGSEQPLPFAVRIEPRDGAGHIADVIIDNRLTIGNVGDSTLLSINGLTVRVEIAWGPGLTPDRVTVIVPDDCIAIPDMIDVPEDATGVIRIFRLSGMVMG